MDNELLINIRHELQDARRDVLTQFVAKFMEVLISEGYTFADLLEAIASWADSQQYTKTVKHLEEASKNL